MPERSGTVFLAVSTRKKLWKRTLVLLDLKEPLENTQDYCFIEVSCVITAGSVLV